MSKQITITIDGKTIQTTAGKNILDAALELGIYIPHLCHHPELTPLGSCKLCIVEHQGELVSSCTLKAEDGMVIVTENDQLNKRRRMAMELILAAHPEDCSTCPKYGNCELQTLIQYLGVSAEGRRRRKKDFSLNEANPLLDHDLYRCVLCGRCVRVCQQVRGVKVLDYLKKADETYAGILLGDSLIDSDCRFCGACAEVCPTGAIRDRESLMDVHKTKEENLIPCKNTCPAGTDIPRYVRLVKEGRIEEASAVIREKLPIPKILGHICSHPCEEECRRSGINESISMRDLKLYAVENDLTNSWKERRKQQPDTGKKIVVVGSGPAGLSAAYYLRKQGHGVKIIESLSVGGGMPRVGIPEYRIPRDIIEEEIALIQEVGVDIEYGVLVTDYKALKEQYDAVLIAIGAHNGVRIPMEGSQADGVFSNIEFLTASALHRPQPVGNRVIVLGGGNVAFDCARTAVRLGAKEVHMACLESEATIPGSKEEIRAAEEEGIQIHYSKSFVKIQEQDGHAKAIELKNVTSMHIDPIKGLVVETEDNSNHQLAADNIIFATGQRPAITEAAGLELKRGNQLQVNERQMTSEAGIFAAGDCIYGTKSVVMAVASGRDAAQIMDKYLGGDGNIAEVLTEYREPDSYIGRIEAFGKIKRVVADELGKQDRTHNFDRVEQTYSCEQAACESSRCLQCDLRFKIAAPRLWNQYEGQVQNK